MEFIYGHTSETFIRHSVCYTSVLHNCQLTLKMRMTDDPKYFSQVENTLSTYEPHCIVIVYSVVDRSSFHLAEDILGYLWRIGFADNGKSSIILCANKVDLERSRNIHQEGKKDRTILVSVTCTRISIGQL